MPEIQCSVETNDNLREGLNFSLICRLLNSRLGRAVIFVLLTKAPFVLSGCASKFRYFTPDECMDYNAITYKEGESGKHGYKKLFVFSKDGKEFLCNIKPGCEEVEKDEEKPEPPDCIDFSKPCVEQ